MKGDATWIVRAGLADSACVSFESANVPGDYLRHYAFQLHLQPASLWAQDTSWLAAAPWS